METPGEELSTGSTFANRYQIIEELGKGGMGKVYKAHDTEIKEKVALKLIKPEIAADKKTIERFQNELKFARKIGHRNVCRMYDLNKEEGSYYITMEYVGGENLKSMIRMTKQLSVGTAIDIAKQVCEGLSEAHRLGVVHRDLKSSNIMIDKEGNVRIMDFGIARSLKEKGITGAGVMIGTPEYMSPEQVEGKEVDQRSDIYSLGVILYEMVTGQVPFRGDTPFTIGMKHKGEIPRDPKELNTQIPEDLSRVILRCLEKNTENRYQSAGELHSELESIDKGIPTAERVIPERKPLTSREITVQFSLKKLFIPAVVIVALAIIAVVIWQIFPQKEPAPLQPQKLSIAVLPFEDLSPNKDQEYFCDGMADELINRLTNIESLRVPARTSAFSFKGKGLDIREIGEKLEVENVLEGSIRKAGNKLRITIQLVNAADGYPLWSEKYERDEEDIFALQDEISLAIVDKLKIKLLRENKVKVVKRHTKVPEAYNLYLKGHFYVNKMTEDTIKIGIEYFEKAIEKDPSYALAYLGLAKAYDMYASLGLMPPKEAWPIVKLEVMKALKIDETLAEAHLLLADIKFLWDWDWESSEREFIKAIELNPRLTDAHHWYAFYLMAMGRHEEAIAEIKHALELDPLSIDINRSVGVMLYNAREYDQAIEQYRNTLKLDPNFIQARIGLGTAYMQKRMYKEAILEFQKLADSKDGSHTALVPLASTYALSGKTREAEKILEDLRKQDNERYISPYQIASIYIALNDKDQAFEWLEKAYKEHSSWLAYLKVQPHLDKIRSDTRFKALLKKMGLN